MRWPLGGSVTPGLLAKMVLNYTHLGIAVFESLSNIIIKVTYLLINHSIYPLKSVFFERKKLDS